MAGDRQRPLGLVVEVLLDGVVVLEEWDAAWLVAATDDADDDNEWWCCCSCWS